MGQDTACLCPIAGHRAHTSQTLDSALSYFRPVPFIYWQPVALRYIWTARSHHAQRARWHLPVQLCTRNFKRRPTACFLYTCRIYSMSPVSRLMNARVLSNNLSLWYSPLYYIISRFVNPLFPNLYFLQPNIIKHPTSQNMNFKIEGQHTYSTVAKYDKFIIRTPTWCLRVTRMWFSWQCLLNRDTKPIEKKTQTMELVVKPRTLSVNLHVHSFCGRTYVSRYTDLNSFAPLHLWNSCSDPLFEIILVGPLPTSDTSLKKTLWGVRRTWERASPIS